MHRQRVKDRWLYLLMTVIVVVLILVFNHAYNDVPKRILVDEEIQREVDDRFLKASQFIKVQRFVGVEEAKIIFRVNEKGE